MNKNYVVACNKNLLTQMNKYLNQHTGFTYKVIFIESYTVFIPMMNLFDAIFEDIHKFIGVVDDDCKDEQKKEKLLKLRDLINNYNKNIVSSKVEQPIFDFGGCIGYPRS
ncbi:MAG: hypothetical protein ACR2LR_12040 [Hassallia sp.]